MFNRIVLFFIFYVCTLQLHAQHISPASSREETYLNGTWDFKSNASGEWTTIQVPGCYSILRDGKWNAAYWDPFGYPHSWTGRGAVYRKKVHISPSMENKHLTLHMGGCLQHYTVIFDGKEFPEVHDGYTTAEFSLGTGFKTGEYLLEIRISDEKSWLNGGESDGFRGIWQDVYLKATDLVFVSKGIFVQTSFPDKGIQVEVPVSNSGKMPREVSVRCFVTDVGNPSKIIKEIGVAKQFLKGKDSVILKLSNQWSDPHLWFPHDPHLYQLHTVISDPNGKQLDWHKQVFGFRTISWDGPNLYINGRKLYLRGHGGHFLGDIQGSKEYFVTWFKELKKLGVNFMRLHLYPRQAALYEAADEVGFLLESEPAFHFKVPEDQEFAKKHLGNIIIDQRNHPSVIMWSVSNELRWSGGGEKPWLIEHAKKLDPTRPVFSSDFSEFSTSGDLLGHHYDTDSVFAEWEKYGHNKPMIWDEMGSVWQPTRPLSNGTTGYEVSSQDHATGLYRDGHDEIGYAFKMIREGKMINGKLHRVNAVIPWDLSYVFFRWPPYNRFKGICLQPPKPGAKGTSPNHVLPACSPLNIWDPTLPVLEPNPGFYLFQQDLKDIRFCQESQNLQFFPDQKIQLKTPLLMYDDLRITNKITCSVEDLGGRPLSLDTVFLNLQPGDILNQVNWTFTIPPVDQPMKITLARTFYERETAGYCESKEAIIYPRFSAKYIPEKRKTIGVIDTTGQIQELLTKAEIAHTECTFHQLDGIDILLVKGSKASPLLSNWIKKGLCVAYFEQDTTMLLPGGAYRLLNGPKHRILQDIGQENLSFWKNGNTFGGMPRPVEGNTRLVLAGDKNGKTSSLHECWQGKGIEIFTSLKLLENVYLEPAAGWIFRNILTRLLEYSPSAQLRKVGVYGAEDFVKYFNSVGLVSNEVRSLKQLDKFDALVLDGRKAIPEKDIITLKKFGEQGKDIFIYRVSESSIQSFTRSVHPKLELTKPYLDERTQCVKAAVSWTYKQTPQDKVAYYDDVLIPQPFESNLDPLLSGISNIDLYWNGDNMFDKGIRLNGTDPVFPSGESSILISNWRNDWSIPPAGGEYINVGKDIRRMNWFLQRDPVLLRVPIGDGSYLFCQLDLLNGGEKGKSLARHILSSMRCPLSVETYFENSNQVFDSVACLDQKKRFTDIYKEQQKLDSLSALPAIFYDRGKETSATNKENVLVLLNKNLVFIAAGLTSKLNESAYTRFSEAAQSTGTLLASLETVLGGEKPDVVFMVFSFDNLMNNEGIIDEKEWTKFENDLQKLVPQLKNTGAKKLMWGSSLPTSGKIYSTQIIKGYGELNKRTRNIMEGNKWYIVDLYSIVEQDIPGVFTNPFIKPDQVKATLIKAIDDAIRFFGE